MQRIFPFFLFFVFVKILFLFRSCGSYGPGPTIVAGTDVATFEIDNFSYAYTNGFTAPVADIVDMIGTEPDYLYGEYALTQAEISGTP